MLLSSRAGFDPDVTRVLEPLFGDRYTVRVRALPGARPGAARARADHGGRA